ncbi:Uncharacterized protein TCM_027068 [Theobroma cacao]|uniref:Uncharacterized protein n=1 Tax=Theobroma cacao TaxID=3641 RepID=A0A061G987_THECC|nr:Uncharacterized protein TCM_027068 [Theobroma cacao]
MFLVVLLVSSSFYFCTSFYLSWFRLFQFVLSLCFPPCCEGQSIAAYGMLGAKELRLLGGDNVC